MKILLYCFLIVLDQGLDFGQSNSKYGADLLGEYLCRLGFSYNSLSILNQRVRSQRNFGSLFKDNIISAGEPDF